MKVIVTGASGFVGSRIVEELSRRSIEVIAVVRNAKNVPDSWDKHITVIEMDIFDESCYGILEKEEVDVFMHFAWSGTSGQIRGQVDTQLDNVRYSCKLMEMSKKMGCRRFVYAGSIMEYEVMEYIAKDASKPSLGMIYSTAKLTADFMLKTLAVSLNIEYINVLISNIYGPGEKSARFLNTVLRKMLMNKDIELTHCEQKYDFIYITDAVKAIVEAMLKGESMGTYYIGNKAVRQLKDFIEIMMKVTKSRSKLYFGRVPYNNAILSYGEFDTAKVQDELGVVYEYSFKEGLEATVKWIEKEE